jgi:hypothetical protein
MTPCHRVRLEGSAEISTTSPRVVVALACTTFSIPRWGSGPQQRRSLRAVTLMLAIWSDGHVPASRATADEQRDGKESTDHRKRAHRSCGYNRTTDVATSVHAWLPGPSVHCERDIRESGKCRRSRTKHQFNMRVREKQERMGSGACYIRSRRVARARAGTQSTNRHRVN